MKVDLGHVIVLVLGTAFLSWLTWVAYAGKIAPIEQVLPAAIGAWVTLLVAIARKGVLETSPAIPPAARVPLVVVTPPEDDDDHDHKEAS